MTSPELAAAEQQRSVGVDLLRGISVLLVLLIALAQGVGRTLLARGTGWLRLVGRCSYEIYLTHMLVILGLMPLIAAWQAPTSWLLAGYLLLLTASIALGWIVHALYSEPLNRALRSRYPAVPC